MKQFTFADLIQISRRRGKAVTRTVLDARMRARKISPVNKRVGGKKNGVYRFNAKDADRLLEPGRRGRPEKKSRNAKIVAEYRANLKAGYMPLARKYRLTRERIRQILAANGMKRRKKWSRRT